MLGIGYFWKLEEKVKQLLTWSPEVRRKHISIALWEEDKRLFLKREQKKNYMQAPQKF